LSEESSRENSEPKGERFYEPRNWDKVMRIEEEISSESAKYCGRCGHIIYGEDRFCTKCGAESRSKSQS